MRAVGATYLVVFAFLVLSASAHAASVSASAHAASVSGPPGQVLVRTVDGFTPIDKLTEVKPGVQIAVLPGSLAHISYNNQCLVVLGPGQVWAVPRTSPCAPGQWVVNLSSPPPKAPPLTGATAVTSAGTTGLLIIGGVVVGAGAFFATQGGDSSNTPASP